jgi:predicted GNAT family acetyltransferase
VPATCLKKTLSMNNVQFDLKEDGTGTFYLEEDDEKVAEMVVGIQGKNMTVYHTEVEPEQEGKGLAKTLFSEMVEHARSNHLKVIPLCTYVQVQFKKSGDEFADVLK